MPLLRKKSTVAVHFYKTGGVRLLQKTKVKAKSGRGRPKTVRQIVLLEPADVNALALIVHEAQAKESIAAKKAADRAQIKADKLARKAAAALLVAPKLDAPAESEQAEADVNGEGGVTSEPETIIAPAVDHSQILSENPA